jgi:gamma-glutamylaminecyclotransferase
MRKIFVYGTLKKGFINHWRLKDSRKIGDGWVYGELYSVYSNSLPILKASDVSKVYGEIYEVSLKTLRRLDKLEGHPGWYRRTRVFATLGYEVLEVEVYVFQGHKNQHWHRIANGIWKG